MKWRIILNTHLTFGILAKKILKEILVKLWEKGIVEKVMEL